MKPRLIISECFHAPLIALFCAGILAALVWHELFIVYSVAAIPVAVVLAGRVAWRLLRRTGT